MNFSIPSDAYNIRFHCLDTGEYIDASYIGGDDGKDQVSPFEKVKNWLKDKVKAIVDKLKGLFTLPKFHKA